MHKQEPKNTDVRLYTGLKPAKNLHLSDIAPEPQKGGCTYRNGSDIFALNQVEEEKPKKSIRKGGNVESINNPTKEKKSFKRHTGQALLSDKNPFNFNTEN